MKKDQYIGIFDSGIGGLTVLEEIISILPNENIIYLGDTARVPYGTRSRATIARYFTEAMDFFSRFGIKVLVAACNTVSANALDELKDDLDFPAIGVIHAPSRAAVSVTKNKRIGVIGTEATVNSGAYKRAIKQIDADIEVYSKACPLLVPLVEEGWLEGSITQGIVDTYLSELVNEQVDTLILGCTHYPLLKKCISKCMGSEVILVDSGAPVVNELKEYLLKKNILNHDATACRKIYLTEPIRESTKYMIEQLDLGISYTQVEVGTLVG